MISEELLKKYEKEIENFVAIKQMDDEIVFKAIQMQGEQLIAYSRNIKTFLDKFRVGDAEKHLPLLKEIIKRTEILLTEARKRASGENEGENSQTESLEIN